MKIMTQVSCCIFFFVFINLLTFFARHSHQIGDPLILGVPKANRMELKFIMLDTLISPQQEIFGDIGGIISIKSCFPVINDTT